MIFLFPLLSSFHTLQPTNVNYHLMLSELETGKNMKYESDSRPESSEHISSCLNGISGKLKGFEDFNFDLFDSTMKYCAGGGNGCWGEWKRRWARTNNKFSITISLSWLHFQLARNFFPLSQETRRSNVWNKRQNSVENYLIMRCLQCQIGRDRRANVNFMGGCIIVNPKHKPCLPRLGLNNTFNLIIKIQTSSKMAFKSSPSFLHHIHIKF